MAEPTLETRLSAPARAGDVPGLIDLIDTAAADNDALAFLSYKWLCVAVNVGHEDASEMVGAVLDGLLYADDDNYVTGHAHLELAVAYLTGADDLPVDYDRAS